MVDEIHCEVCGTYVLISPTTGQRFPHYRPKEGTSPVRPVMEPCPAGGGKPREKR